VVVLGVACVMGAGAGVLYVYQRLFVETVFDRFPRDPFVESLADAGSVGIGLVLVHALVRWGTEVGWRSGGKRVWGWVGGCSVAVVVLLLLWLSPTDRCRGAFELLPIWIVVAAWWLSGDSKPTGGSRGWSDYATAGVVLLVYAVSVFPVLPWQLGGGRPSTAFVLTVDGVFPGEVTRWRSGDWVFPRDETPGRWIPWWAQRIDVTGAALGVAQREGETAENPMRPEAGWSETSTEALARRRRLEFEDEREAGG
jgi:hypothetical protein